MNQVDYHSKKKVNNLWIQYSVTKHFLVSCVDLIVYKGRQENSVWGATSDEYLILPIIIALRRTN